jgi:hypothetical protein
VELSLFFFKPAPHRCTLRDEVRDDLPGEQSVAKPLLGHVLVNRVAGVLAGDKTHRHSDAWRGVRAGIITAVERRSMAGAERPSLSERVS